MKRIFDLLLALLAVMLLLLPLALLALAVALTSRGPILYWSDRVGCNNVTFRMPKFRSMRTGTPVVATHLLSSPDAYLTPIGSFLRLSSLDELPQLWSIFRGDMSFVGPRPALFNQQDLIELRTRSGVHALLPGLTGWAQIHGRNGLDWPARLELDARYVEMLGTWYAPIIDVWILIVTFFQVAWQGLTGRGVTAPGAATMREFLP